MSRKKIEKNDIIISKRFVQIREYFGLNQTEFAKKLGYKPNSINDIENYKTQISKNMIFALLSVFKINPTWLLTGEGEMFLSDVPSTEVVPIQEAPLRDILEFIQEFWREASEKEKIWLEVQFGRCFPEFEVFKKRRSLADQDAPEVNKNVA